MREHPESELHRCGKMFGVLLYSNNHSIIPSIHQSPIINHHSIIPSIHQSPIINHQSIIPSIHQSPIINHQYLAAFSAKLDGSYHHEGFVPPVYELTDPPVGTSKEESRRLQRLLFANYNFLNGHGQTKNLLELFQNEKVLSPEDWFADKSKIINHKFEILPPSGAGECCAPKLLQYALSHGLKPLALAEFWIGAPPKNEIRREGAFYPPCSGRCMPILRHMLQGIDNLQIAGLTDTQKGRVEDIETLYEDDYLIVINKPAGLLSVPGKTDEPSAETLLHAKAVHRLDQDTSGLLVLAKTPEVYTALQSYFQRRDILKRYEAVVKPNEGVKELKSEGVIDSPLLPNPYDRPRQMVDREHGKPAITRYVIRAQRPDGTLLVDFYPLTGRTHQLRVHAAHPDGLNAPIVGDRLYGQPAERLMLHAAEIRFIHPVTAQEMHFLTNKFAYMQNIS
jgi:tRNA pseudouridine32 synthase/23S rRNA pseudouridine746 synthase